MLLFIAKRLLFAIPTLFGVLTLVFFLVRIVPGDPAMVVLGDQASPDALAALRERLGLNKPLIVQFGEYLSGIATGDLGRSLTTNRPVMTDMLAVLPYTIELTVAALAIGVVFGLPLGATNRTQPFMLPELELVLLEQPSSM